MIVRWVEGGVAEGDRAKLPVLPPVVEGWDLGTPDLVLAMAAPFDIQAEPRSVSGDFPLETRFGEDRFIEAAEVRPGAPEVTHHANVLVKDEGGTNRIASYSPGTGAKRYPPGVAKRLPKGTVLNLNMHYNPRSPTPHAIRARASPSSSLTAPCARSRSPPNPGPTPSTSRRGASNHEIVGTAICLQGRQPHPDADAAHERAGEGLPVHPGSSRRKLAPAAARVEVECRLIGHVCSWPSRSRLPRGGRCSRPWRTKRASGAEPDQPVIPRRVSPSDP